MRKMETGNIEAGYQTISQKILTGERALFHGKNLRIEGTIFEDGESPLKHGENIELSGSMFKWKYPLWYAKNIRVKDCTLFEMARAGIWYTDDITVEDTLIEAPKSFRRCRGLAVRNVSIPNAQETLWNCRDVELSKVTAKGDYFGMGCEDVQIRDFTLYGNYCFDGARNVEVHNAKFLSKDCFWNAENITIYDSFISGEYFGWNSRNVTLVNCTVESLQGMCYMENLVLINCRLLNTTLAFEYSTVDVDIVSCIDSVKNPSGGIIRAERIGELIMENGMVDPSKTKVICRSGSRDEPGGKYENEKRTLAECQAVKEAV